MKLIQSIKSWIEDFDKATEAVSELELAYEFYKEGEFSEEELDQNYQHTQELIESLEFKNMLSEEADSFDAVLQITAGAGGTESCDWASMLMRMYLMWASKHNYKVKELNLQDGDVAGIKTVSLAIEGEFAWLAQR